MTNAQARRTRWGLAIRSLIRHCAFLLASLSATMWALTAVCGISCQPTQNTLLRVELGRIDASYTLSQEQDVQYTDSRLSLTTSYLDHWNPSRAVQWNQRSWWILRRDNFYTASDGNCGGGEFHCSTVGAVFDATRWAIWDSSNSWGVQFPLWLPAGTCTALLLILSGRAIILTFILRRAIARDSDSITAPQENPHTKSSPHRFHKRLINLLPWHGYGLAVIFLLVLPASYWSYTRYDQYWDQRFNFNADPIKEFLKWFPSIVGDKWDPDIFGGLRRLLATAPELQDQMTHIYPTLASQEQESFLYLLSDVMLYYDSPGVTGAAHTSKDGLLPLIMIGLKHESGGPHIAFSLAFYDIPGRKDILQSFIANPQTKPDMLESVLSAYLYNYDAEDIEDDLNRLLLGPYQINVAVQLLKPKSAGPWRDRALQLVHVLIRQYPHSTTIFEMLNQHYDTCGDYAMAQHAHQLLDSSPLNMSLAPTRNETQEPNCLTPHQAPLTTTDIQILLEYLIDCSDD